jgi:hypothetical protein
MTKISAKVEALLQKSKANDGVIDTAEAKQIAQAAKPSEWSDVAQRLMDDGFSAPPQDLQDLAKLLHQPAMPSAVGTVTLQKAQFGLVVTHMEIDGVRFKMALPSDQRVDPQVLKAMAKAVNDANALIADPAKRVHDVVIAANVTTRLTSFAQKPILVIDRRFADASTVTHESGHAVFDALRDLKPPETALKVVALYNRLAGTTSVVGTERPAGGKPTKAEHPAGLWPFDPSQWSKSLTTEHPWDNADEFFASALAAASTDRKGLEQAIAAYTKNDPAVGAAAKELLALLDGLKAGTSTPPMPSGAERDSAKAGLSAIGRANPVEAVIGVYVSLQAALQWTEPKPATP